MLRCAADVLAPQDCFVCGSACGGSVVCPACEAELPLLRGACPRCALPVADGSMCGACLRAPPAFDASRAVFRYAFPVDRMVQALKYRHRLALARFFADALAARGRPDGIDLILPMPLHPGRLRTRGFNQAVEIARPLARRWKLPLELARVGRCIDTAAQAGLPRPQRVVNLRGAFACETPLTGLSILVVDDVMTTGASLDELARVLKRQGAKRVENWVIARTAQPE